MTLCTIFGTLIERKVIFTIDDEQMILLHGFIKKSQKTEKKDIDLAAKRRKYILGK